MIRNEERRRGRVALLAYGPLVRAAREAAGLSPKQLCACIDMSLAQLSDIERGIGSLSLRRVRQLADALHLPEADVLAGVLQERLNEAGFSKFRVQVQAVDESQIRRRIPSDE